MFKRFLALVVGLAGLSASVKADNNKLTLGSATFSIPQGWKQIDGTDDRLTFAAPDGRQQATVSVMRFEATPSFQDFELICTHRYEAEKTGLSDLNLTPTNPAPRDEGAKFTMTFSGKENPSGRIFSGLLSLKGKELVTIYLEGMGVDSKTNIDSFKEFLASLKQ
jgi:hypothetical protein